jgi:hypothetical protein
MAGKYVITGRVQPERADISFGRVEMKLDEGQSAVASCDSSQITVTLNMPKLDGWIAAMIVAEDIATIMIGALGFSLGSGYRVELIQVTEEDGTPHVFGVRPSDPTSGGTLGVEPQIEVFNRAFRLSGHNLFFRLAIRDYLEAITDFRDCATYCYRAIEGIKSAFVMKSGVDSWDEMHKALGTDRHSITSTVKNFADPVRHGNWIEAKRTDKFIRWRMLAMTRDILVKYLDHEQPTI